jgi:hypothetical protein
MRWKWRWSEEGGGRERGREEKKKIEKGREGKLTTFEGILFDFPSFVLPLNLAFLCFK